VENYDVGLSCNSENNTSSNDSLFSQQLHGQRTLNFEPISKHLISRSSFKYSQTNSKKMLIDMIIIDELPLSFSEKIGFKTFARSLNSDFDIPGRTAITKGVEERYKDLKCQLSLYLQTSQIEGAGRISITSDIWTASHQKLCYTTITIHFIDQYWKLRMIVINFPVMPYPHSGNNIADVLIQSLKDWKVVHRLFGMTVDNASNNDTMLKRLKDLISASSSVLFLQGKFFFK
jgi:hypothetical protein